MVARREADRWHPLRSLLKQRCRKRSAAPQGVAQRLCQGRRSAACFSPFGPHACDRGHACAKKLLQLTATEQASASDIVSYR